MVEEVSTGPLKRSLLFGGVDEYGLEVVKVNLAVDTRGRFDVVIEDDLQQCRERAPLNNLVDCMVTTPATGQQQRWPWSQEI
jgi:hypothetical protein